MDGKTLPPELDPSDWISYPLRPERKTLIQIHPGQVDRIATKAENALIEAQAAIFQRAAWLVRPYVYEVQASRGRTVHTGGLQQLSPVAVIDMLAQSADFQQYDGRAKRYVEVDPPGLVATILLSRVGQWNFPPISGVITTPTLRPDGSILSKQGYDHQTKLFFMMDPNLILPPIPAHPTREDAEKALGLLNGLLSEFPFNEEVDRAVALSAIVTSVVRGGMEVAPLHAFRAPAPGSGKSYLADTISSISAGRPSPAMSASIKPEETEKRLIGLLLKGFPLINIDNVNGELGSDLLCQAVERPLLSLRPLGTSEMFEVPNCATIIATGNNLTVRDDLVRRTLLCSLDAKMERPELREFKGNPVATVLKDRGTYVAACLTISRAYIVAGCPGQLKNLASFEDWSRLVRSALVWLGCEDPAKTIEMARDEDPGMTEMREVFDAWISCVGLNNKCTLATLVEIANHKVMDEDSGYAASVQPGEALKSALLTISRRHDIDKDTIGKWLRGRKKKIISLASEDAMGNVTQSMYRLMGGSPDKKGKKATLWWIERV